VFYAIGHEPNTGFLRETPVELDDEGCVETLDPDEAWATTATAANGVFAAGDVMDTEYQQAVTAAGMGSMAALDAEEFLESTPDAAATTTAATAVSGGRRLMVSTTGADDERPDQTNDGRDDDRVDRRPENRIDPSTVADQADRLVVSFRAPEADPDENDIRSVDRRQ